MILFWKPTGKYVGDWMQFKDGASVEGYEKIWRKKKKIKNGTIRVKRNSEYSQLVTNEVWIDYNGKSVKLGYYWIGDAYDGTFNTYSRDSYELYIVNKFKKGASMANKLLSALKLNKDQRKLQKAGVYDENGNLTTDGTELMLNWLAQQHETELVKLVKDLVPKSKKDEDDK